MSADPADKYRWILKSSSTTQGQVFYVMAKNGALMVLQLVYSSMNSWSHSVQAGCRIHIPGQPPKTLNVSLGASAMQISPDKLSVTANPIAITHTAPLTFHLTYKKDDVDVNVDFACVGSDVCFNGGDEKWHKATREGGFIKAHFIPRASVSGTIKVGDITHDAHGVGSAVFAVQNMPQNVARFDLMIFHGDNDWLFLYQYKTPIEASYTTKKASHATLVYKGTEYLLTTNNKTIFNEPEIDAFSGYPIPQSLVHQLKGEAPDGMQIIVSVELNLDHLLEKVDVLGELPYLVKKFIQAFITSPFCYQWLEKAKITVNGVSVAGVAFEEAFLMAAVE